VVERPIDLGIAEPGQALARRLSGTAARLFATSPCFLTCKATIASRPARVGVEVTPGDRLVSQAPGLFERPGREGGDKLDLFDQPILKGKLSEKATALMAWLRSSAVDHANAPAGVTGPEIELRRPDYRTPSLGFHTCRRALITLPRSCMSDSRISGM
jgi:hypothetical protein